MTDRYLIVGLGNPGRDYENTRHNIGFRAADAIAATYGFPRFDAAKKQAKALVVDGTIADQKVLIAKPQTYMNLSGESVQGLAAFYKIAPQHILVLHDDMDIPLGTLRIRSKGSAGGQNGLKDILNRLGTQEVPRVRIGIGRPPGRMNPADYVLQPFAKNEEILVVETVDRVVKSAETWIRFGIELMMTRHNGTAEESAREAARAAQPKPAKNADKAPDKVSEKVPEEAPEKIPSQHAATPSSDQAE
jgi:peptidyl-tRNA hydrolase, PTH1 family